jgi:outer membrane receptor protein involved in Fe transport
MTTVASLALSNQTYGAEPAQYNLKIDAEPLGDALQDFARQSGIQIIFFSKVTEGRVARALNGRFTAQGALRILLGDSALTFREINPTTIEVRPVSPASTKTSESPEAIRVADVQDPGVASTYTRSVDAGSDQGSMVDSRSDTLQEVVVTAQRRSETLLNVPMSISVLSEKSLQAQEIKTFNDFAAEIPNLSFSYGQSAGADDRGVAIRGIQGADTTGFYLDDLPMPISLNPRVLDMNRIEVLRGPQGTLYGAGSMGGTIRMITNAPDLAKLSGDADIQGASIDGGGNGYQAYGTFNIPLVLDRLALRVTPFSGEDPGYINRTYPSPSEPGTLGEVKNTASEKYKGVVASILWRPLDSLTIRPSLMYQTSASNGLPLGDYSASNLTNHRDYDIQETLQDRWTYSGVAINYSTAIGAITSATSLLDRHSHYVEDSSEVISLFFAPARVSIPVAESTRVMTEELRFASSWSGPVQFVGGLFYEKTDTTHKFDVVVNDYLPLFGSSTLAYRYLPQTLKERAIFGELTYEFTSLWSATLGARYSKDESTTGGDVWGLSFGTLSAENAASNASSESDSVVTPKLLVKYKPNENTTIYADAAKGFRPGNGEVPPPTSLCTATYAAYNLTPAELSSYGPDSVWSYELGAKRLSDDHRYSLTGALFYINWTDIREILGFPACGFTATINSAKAYSRGGEFEFSARPLERLTLNGGLGYDDAKISNPGTLISLPPAGSPIQEVTPWTANLSAQYVQPLVDDTQILLRGDYSYTGRSYSTANDPVDPRLRPSYALTNVRAALRHGPIEYAVFVKNLTDAHPNLGDQLSQTAEYPGRPRWETGPPRTYGIEFHVSY